jgi:hypothetical protein
LGSSLSIDRINLSLGELYKVVSNKDGKEKKDSIVTIIPGNKSEIIINFLQKIDMVKRSQVTEIALNMTNSMKLIAKKSLPKVK